jgi:hypothetical protein
MNKLKNPKKIFLPIAVLFVALFIVVGCTPPPPPDTESEGGKMYIAKCGTCHPPRHPKILNYKRWVRMVDKMEKKVKVSGTREPMTDGEREILLGYLKKHARTQ